jgi:cytochrome c-type biogenesis protein CcmH
MEGTNQQPKFLSSAQTYSMAVICLILGIAVGYLVRTPAAATSSAPAVSQRPAMNGAARAMPSPADMKRMADKQVAPMLDELQKNPKDADLLAKVGRAYLAAQQYPDAQQYLEQSAALKNDPETLNALSFVYYSMGNIDKAIEALNRALKVDPKNPQALFNLGMYQWHGKSDPKAAIAAWQRFVRTNPDNPKRAQVEKMIAQAKQHLNLPPGAKTDKPVM